MKNQQTQSLRERTIQLLCDADYCNTNFIAQRVRHYITVEVMQRQQQIIQQGEYVQANLGI